MCPTAFDLETNGAVTWRCLREMNLNDTETAAEVWLWLISVMWVPENETRVQTRSFYYGMCSPLSHQSSAPTTFSDVFIIQRLIPLRACPTSWPIQVTRCSHFTAANTTDLQAPCSHRHHNHMWQIILLFHTPGPKTSSSLSNFISLAFLCLITAHASCFFNIFPHVFPLEISFAWNFGRGKI